MKKIKEIDYFDDQPKGIYESLISLKLNLYISINQKIHYFLFWLLLLFIVTIIGFDYNNLFSQNLISVIINLSYIISMIGIIFFLFMFYTVYKKYFTFSLKSGIKKYFLSTFFINSSTVLFFQLLPIIVDKTGIGTFLGFSTKYYYNFINISVSIFFSFVVLTIFTLFLYYSRINESYYIDYAITILNLEQQFYRTNPLRGNLTILDAS